MIKRFTEFINESRYDSLALTVTRQLFNFVKSTRGTPVGKLKKFEMEYSEPIEFSVFFVVKRVISFNPTRSKHFSSMPWEVFNFEEMGFSMDANSYTPSASSAESPELEIVLYISPDAEPLAYEELNRKMIDYVRHEIEHFLQKGVNRKLGHEVSTSQRKRAKAQSSYQYLLLADEIPAMVAGLHAAAVKRKTPIDVEFDRYLQTLIKGGVITQEEYSKVMQTWIDFAKTRYPHSKFSNKVY